MGAFLQRVEKASLGSGRRESRSVGRVRHRDTRPVLTAKVRMVTSSEVKGLKKR